MEKISERYFDLAEEESKSRARRALHWDMIWLRASRQGGSAAKRQKTGLKVYRVGLMRFGFLKVYQVSLQFYVE
jgi:hypothetical protein